MCAGKWLLIWRIAGGMEMESSFEAVRLNEKVYWVGAIDWAVRDFHGYLTSRGTTYNAYLIMAEKITLVDTVKRDFADELLARIASVVEPERIDYIVLNHAELDPSGALPAVIDAGKPEGVYSSPMGKKALAEHFHWDVEVEAVKTGETLSLGDRTLAFTETRMLHWPDSMFSYLVEDRLLFSQDGFGMHLASSERFADQIDDSILEYEGAKYFANILTPYSGLVVKLLEKTRQSGLELAMIAPDHGPIWRRDPGRIVEMYSRYATVTGGKKAVVAYDTMWGSTDVMARAIGDGLAAGGAAVTLMAMGVSHRSDVATHLLDAGALVIGSPTLNNNMFPSIADLLTYLGGLRFPSKVAAAFGSYGWSGEGVKHVSQRLSDMGHEVVGSLRCKYVPDSALLAQCRALGAAVADKLPPDRADES